MTKELDTTEPKVDFDRLREFIDVTPWTGKAKGRPRPEYYKLWALTIKSSGATYQTVADVLGVSKSTAHRLVQNVNMSDPRVEELVGQIKKQYSGKCFLTANDILSSIDDDDMAKASAYQKVGMSCMLLDKARLCSGESTDNISIVTRRYDQDRDKTIAIKDELTSVESDIRRLEDSLKEDVIDVTNNVKESERPKTDQ